MKYVFLFLFFISSSLLSQEKLISLENCDDLNMPFDRLYQCAKEGDYFIQYNLGVMYRDGIVVEKSDKQAFHWLFLSAKQGYSKAQLNLGQLYKYGIGVEKNDKLAFDWTEKAANQGELAAINNLANYYFDGFGTEKDIKKALTLYHLVAGYGITEAQINLSLIYFNGSGVNKDINNAIYWAEQAAYNDSYLAMALLGVFYRELTQYEKALMWSKRATEREIPLAEANLAYMYSFGLGKEPNAELAKSWLNKAINQNDPDANIILGNIYETGNSIIQQDEAKALELYLKAAKTGDGAAQNNVGRILINSNSGLRDENKAVKWFLKAANESNVTESMYALYQIYNSGTGKISKDTKKANYWLERAKENGFEP